MQNVEFQEEIEREYFIEIMVKALKIHKSIIHNVSILLIT